MFDSTLDYDLTAFKNTFKGIIAIIFAFLFFGVFIFLVFFGDFAMGLWYQDQAFKIQIGLGFFMLVLLFAMILSGSIAIKRRREEDEDLRLEDQERLIEDLRIRNSKLR